MSFISGDKSISRLSIPGTHNSCTFTLNDSLDQSFAKTQDHSILAPLEYGVRYLDARCRHISDSFSIHHEAYYLNLRFGEVLTDCYNFLDANPVEFIIIQVKEEHNRSNCTRGFDETFEALYYDSFRMVHFSEERLPTVAEARGKVVIFSAIYWETHGV